MNGTKNKTGRKDLKLKRDPPFKGIPTENDSAGSSGVPLRGPAATSEPAVELSVEGRKEPVVQNLPEAQPKPPLLGVSITDIPLQGAGPSSKPAAGEGAGHLVPEIGGLLPARKPYLDSLNGS
jgi:hypothetical protein